MMKKRIYTILSSLVLLASCNYLDIKPVGQVIPETVTEHRAMLTTAYQAFPLYKDLLGLRADETFPYSGEYGLYDAYINQAVWMELSSDNIRNFPWMRVYKGIFYANSVIAGADEALADTHEDSGEQLKAEALLLRAYSHFELLNLYAVPYNAATASTDRGIPLALEIDIEQEYVPASVEDVYSQILADLREAEELMQVEEQPQTLRYRFSKKSARALEARVRLYRSEWDLALAAAEELLPCELENLNNADALPPYYYNSKESILALEKLADRDFVTGDMYMLPAIMDKYNKEEDTRVSLYFKLRGGDYWPAKGNSDQMKVTFRSAEIYLIAAEAAAHTGGKLDIAKNYLKQLMINRLTPGYYEQKARQVDGMGQEALLDEIMDERARELACEGHRWYDLRRTARPEIRKTFTDQNGNEKTVVLLKDDPRYTIRFPEEATENNPNLNN